MKFDNRTPLYLLTPTAPSDSTMAMFNRMNFRVETRQARPYCPTEVNGKRPRQALAEFYLPYRSAAFVPFADNKIGANTARALRRFLNNGRPVYELVERNGKTIFSALPRLDESRVLTAAETRRRTQALRSQTPATP